MQSWLHRYLDDERVNLSVGFDELDHPQYMRFPFWIMWSVFSPTATFDDIKKQIEQMDSPENHSYDDRKFCSFVRSHAEWGCRKLISHLVGIGRVDCDGKFCHNNDELKTLYNDDKLEYLRHYRFNLTPENTNYDGYVTEKLFEAIQAGCVPIYNGSDNHPEPDILNQDAIVFVEMNQENPKAMEFISELNSNEKTYMDFACQKRFTKEAPEKIWSYYEQLESRLSEIIKNI